MKTLQQLRGKYWSNATSLYPAATSPSKLEVRFDFSQFGIDKHELEIAQSNFFSAQVCLFSGCDEDSLKCVNRANHHLAGAYHVEGKNVEFWNQFL